MTVAMTDKFRSLGRKFRREAVRPSAPEPVSNKPLQMVGLFSLLSEEQKHKALHVDQDESFGPHEFRRNTC